MSVEDLADKEAVLEAQPETFFTIPHFDNHPAVLIQRERVTRKVLKEALLDGWLASAPPRLTEPYLEQ